MSFESGSRPRHGEDVLHQRAPDSLVLLSLRDGEYFSLDEVGARVWELCDGQRSVGEVIEVVCAEYEAPAETIRIDVLALLDELRDARLLVETG